MMKEKEKYWKEKIIEDLKKHKSLSTKEWCKLNKISYPTALKYIDYFEKSNIIKIDKIKNVRYIRLK